MTKNNLQYEILPSDSEPIEEEDLSPMFGTCMVTLEGSLYVKTIKNIKYYHESLRMCLLLKLSHCITDNLNNMV